MTSERHVTLCGLPFTKMVLEPSATPSCEGLGARPPPLGVVLPQLALLLDALLSQRVPVRKHHALDPRRPEDLVAHLRRHASDQPLELMCLRHV